MSDVGTGVGTTDPHSACGTGVGVCFTPLSLSCPKPAGGWLRSERWDRCSKEVGMEMGSRSSTEEETEQHGSGDGPEEENV